MKKLLSALLLVCCLFALVGCGKKEPQATKLGIEPVPDGMRTFTVGFDAEFPPYGFKDPQTGEYTGFDLELAQEVCNRLGWKLVKKPINWDSKDMELDSGAIDCIWNGFTINGREDKYTWTEPYVDNSQVVIVKVNSPIQTLADLKGKTVAVQTDTPVQKALKEGGDKAELGKSFAKLIVTPNYNNAAMELETGAVDAVAMDIGVAKQKMADAKGKFRMLEEAVMFEKYGIGFKLGNTAMRDEVQSTFKQMVKEGVAAKISAKWFDGKDVIILQP